MGGSMIFKTKDANEKSGIHIHTHIYMYIFQAFSNLSIYLIKSK